MVAPIPSIRLRRKIEAISAAYLPWKPVAKVDFESFERVLEGTWGCGITPAINMDTGFANLLSLAQRHEILDFVARQASGRAFVAGAFVEDLSGDCLDNYRAETERIRLAGGTPIIFQCRDLVRRSDSQIVEAYRSIGATCGRFLGFELGKMFAPFGSIYSIDVFKELLQVPQLVGIKHSSLSRELEWARLSIRDAFRADFRIYTGNDLAIDMVQWGSDYLLGLSAFYPEAFARRDQYWLDGDRRFYELNDALQLLGGYAFRPPVPAYKHNAAMMLAMRGVIASDAIHPNAPSRPSEDREFLKSILDRIESALRA
ncbi:MAG: dihydrodipicolinate synthase family protein [Planctomycetes bacterium]|nr:dihydrodipicolinate synthase family protein [Planctomycetota bacterium]